MLKLSKQFIKLNNCRYMSSTYTCSNCGIKHSKWNGFCKQCNQYNTFIESKDVEIKNQNQSSLLDFKIGKMKEKFNMSNNSPNSKTGNWIDLANTSNGPQQVSFVNTNVINDRIIIPSKEISGVFGGGIVKGSLSLFAGEPGVGKSTLILQLANWIASENKSNSPVIYVSGEETAAQLKMRGKRCDVGASNLLLWNESNVDKILDKVAELRACALVVDSIQTVFKADITGSAGSLAQLKESTLSFLKVAKSLEIPVLLIGHVTKGGEVAGPKSIEHMVDTVLYLEGDKYRNNRFLRVYKNRFGNTSELGVLEMKDNGLHDASINNMFHSESLNESSVGIAVTSAMIGNRPIIVEIQSLCNTYSNNIPQFSSHRLNGVDKDRFHMLIAVLSKNIKSLRSSQVFVNVLGGLQLEEPACDLAIIIAVASASVNISIPLKYVFLGEVSLNGDLKSFNDPLNRLKDVAKVGYKKCFLPISLRPQYIKEFEVNARVAFPSVFQKESELTLFFAKNVNNVLIALGINTISKSKVKDI